MLGLITGLLLSYQTPANLEELAKTYEVKVEVAGEPLKHVYRGYEVTGQKPEQEDLTRYTKLLLEEWTKLPPSFIKVNKLEKIILVSNIAMNGQVRAAVPAFSSHTLYLDPFLGRGSHTYQRSVIHHEFYHMVDVQGGFFSKDPEWTALNPKDFKYGTGGAEMRTAGVGRLRDDLPGFLTLYATAGMEEDKAEIYSHMIVNPAFVLERTKADPVIKHKVQLMIRRLEKQDPAMGKPFWFKIAEWKEFDYAKAGTTRR